VQTQTLPTADDYLRLPDDGSHTELIRGVVVAMPQPSPGHGFVCLNVGSILRDYVRARDLGRVVSNDSGVVTERGPDTVRGPNVAYYSFLRGPKGPLPPGYWPAPELVFKVKSPSDSIRSLIAKANDYLGAGVVVVCVVDPGTESVGVFTADELPRRLSNGDELVLPELFPGFRVPVRQFFA